MPAIGLGAGGPTVVGSRLELFHHVQPWTMPTHERWGMPEAVTWRSRARTAKSTASVIDGAPESTSMTPSFPIEAVMFPPAPLIT